MKKDNSSKILLSVSVTLFFVMFIYSGVNKIMKFDQKKLYIGEED